ncbi:TPA: HAD hydrolase family protein [Streptococcus suis]|nr:HAD hydrolase family protein [Streptococcus suis]HEM3164915.1 HAD hydrolase family protein [Streptococcus suis 92-1191]QZT29209.1 HAD hydrolase family protein [Streptococcus suis]HEM4285340.1 HAD hydrolase family protein [Streptococcus suis]HEM4680081.1 HAD hydrolase family protein [Streptococcus suis]
MVKLTEKLGITLEEVMAVGDGDNDIQAWHCHEECQSIPTKVCG